MTQGNSYTVEFSEGDQVQSSFGCVLFFNQRCGGALLINE